MNIENITNIVVECPHCKEPVLIEKINCCIFRHASFKNTGQQIGPHTEKKLCDFEPTTFTGLTLGLLKLF